jgi:hypothetical protein
MSKDAPLQSAGFASEMSPLLEPIAPLNVHASPVSSEARRTSTFEIDPSFCGSCITFMLASFELLPFRNAVS